MRIKPLDTIDELRGAMRIHNVAWRGAYQDILPDEVINGIPVEPSEDFVEDRFENLGRVDEMFLVAVDDEVIRGYIYVLWSERTKDFVGDDEAGLKEIYVEPDWWGRGLGTDLLNEAIESLPASIEAIRLEMLAGNEQAHKFYSARGFDLVGESEFEIADEMYPTEVYVRSL